MTHPESKIYVDQGDLASRNKIVYGEDGSTYEVEYGSLQLTYPDFVPTTLPLIEERRIRKGVDFYAYPKWVKGLGTSYEIKKPNFSGELYSVHVIDNEKLGNQPVSSPEHRKNLTRAIEEISPSTPVNIISF